MGQARCFSRVQQGTSPTTGHHARNHARNAVCMHGVRAVCMHGHHARNQSNHMECVQSNIMQGTSPTTWSACSVHAWTSCKEPVQPLGIMHAQGEGFHGALKKYIHWTSCMHKEKVSTVH
eukprot:1147362-Pelagomonas_calceolata.AAC.1